MRIRVFCFHHTIKVVKSLKSAGNDVKRSCKGQPRGERGPPMSTNEFKFSTCHVPTEQHMYFITENVHCQLFSKKLQLVIIYERCTGI